MNHSIHSADRATHLKIVVVALVAGIAVAAFGIGTHQFGIHPDGPDPGHEGGQAGGHHQLADLDGPLRVSFSAPARRPPSGGFFVAGTSFPKSRPKSRRPRPDWNSPVSFRRMAPKRWLHGLPLDGAPIALGSAGRPRETPRETRRECSPEPAVNRVTRVFGPPTRRLADTARSLPFQLIFRRIRPDAAQA